MLSREQDEMLKAGLLLISEQAERSVAACTDVDLAKVILLKVACDTQNYDSLLKNINLPESQVRNTFQYLVSENLLRIHYDEYDKKKEHPTLQFLPGVKDGYVRTEKMQGPYYLLELNNVGRERALRAMQAVQDSVYFAYEKTFTFNMEQLQQFKNGIHTRVTELQKEEQQLFHKTFNVADNWTQTPSFVGGKDPTWTEHGQKHGFNLFGTFPTPAQAFEFGFNSATGAPCVGRAYTLKYGGSTNSLFSCIKVFCHEEGYDISLKNTLGSSAVHGAFAFYQETQRVLPLLKVKLENALS